MRARKRWISWILKESAGDVPLLPWERDRRLRRRPAATVLRRIV